MIRPVNNRTPAYLQTLKERSFAVHGPRFFNGIPRELRDYPGEPKEFKLKPDKFLTTVPALPHYV